METVLEPVISVELRTIRRLVCSYLSRYLSQFYLGVSVEEKKVLYIQGVSRGIVNILGGGSMEYSE